MAEGMERWTEDDRRRRILIAEGRYRRRDRKTVAERSRADMVVNDTMGPEGGLEYAKALLKNSVDPSVQVQKTPFAFLQKAESENLLTFIQDEHPQTIALILCHLRTTRGAEILAGCRRQKQIEVVKRIANMEQTNPEVIREVERAWRCGSAACSRRRMEKTGGVPRSPRC
jgi:flagellar motor switch protein FliG